MKMCLGPLYIFIISSYAMLPKKDECLSIHLIKPVMCEMLLEPVVLGWTAQGHFAEWNPAILWILKLHPLTPTIMND